MFTCTYVNVMSNVIFAPLKSDLGSATGGGSNGVRVVVEICGLL